MDQSQSLTGTERKAHSSDPTVAIAFGAGGARGFAHIPVIEALDEMGIRPVAIAGSSIGAIMGAGMAAGMTGAEIREFALETVGRRGAVTSRLWSLRGGTMRDALGGFRFGQFNLETILPAFLPAQLPDQFSGLQIPLTVMATDYYGQREIAVSEGKLVTALAASAAIPALFMPVSLNGALSIDGGIFNPVPYDKLKGRADIIIGVDVVGGPVGDPTEAPSRFDSIFGAGQLTMLSAIQLMLKIYTPEIFLRPPVSGFRVLDFLKAQQVLEATEGLKDGFKRDLEGKLEAASRKSIE
ncbi:patatin-like phospholipase family protein [Agrobacterium sp. ES01]|uniref:patatin-like phospholipase family protein n=1 Tax=Agrobacterium sp. ES01 TaxID=3420714 RepID=UPI003D0A1AB7